MQTDGSYYYDLFKFFNEEHGLILLDSEIQEIIIQVEKFAKKAMEPVYPNENRIGVKFENRLEVPWEENQK